MSIFKNYLYQVSVVTIVVISIGSCTFDQLDPVDASQECLDAAPTYDGEIKALIDNTCAYSGCHVGGFGFGDFSNYPELVPRLENGSIFERTIELQDMPPKNASGPSELTEEERNLLECWIQLGFPRN